MKLLKNKKAEEVFLPEVVKIVLAVIVIGILIFLAVGLYSIFTRSTELEQARGLILEIEGKINQLNEDGKYTDVLVLAPRDWRLISYYEDKTLCVCPPAILLKQKDSCVEEGYCKNLLSFSKVDNYCSGGIFRFYKIDNCLELSKANLPLQLIIENQEGIYELKTSKELVTENILKSLINSLNFEQAVIGLYNLPEDEDKQKELREIVNNAVLVQEELDWEMTILRNDNPDLSVFLSAVPSNAYIQYELNDESNFQEETFKSSNNKVYTIKLRLGEAVSSDLSPTG